MEIPDFSPFFWLLAQDQVLQSRSLSEQSFFWMEPESIYLVCSGFIKKFTKIVNNEDMKFNNMIII